MLLVAQHDQRRRPGLLVEFFHGGAAVDIGLEFLGEGLRLEHDHLHRGGHFLHLGRGLRRVAWQGRHRAAVDLHRLDRAGLLEQMLESREHLRRALAPERKTRDAEPALGPSDLVVPLCGCRRRVAGLLGVIDIEQFPQLLDLGLVGIGRRVRRRHLVDRLHRVFLTRHDRIGHARLKTLLDVREAVGWIGDRGHQRELGVLDQHRVEFVDLPERRQALDHRADTVRPVGGWIKAGNPQRARPLANQFAVVDQIVADQHDALPAFVADLFPLAPEAPDDLRAHRWLLVHLLAQFGRDLRPDVLADKFANIGVAGVADGKTIVDLAIRPEIDFEFAQGNRGHRDRGRWMRPIDPRRHGAEREIRIERLCQFRVEVRRLHGLENLAIVLLDLVLDLVPCAGRQIHAGAALAPRQRFRHERGDDLRDEVLAKNERFVGVEFGGIQHALLRRCGHRRDRALALRRAEEIAFLQIEFDVALFGAALGEAIQRLLVQVDLRIRARCGGALCHQTAPGRAATLGAPGAATLEMARCVP